MKKLLLITISTLMIFGCVNYYDPNRGYYYPAASSSSVTIGTAGSSFSYYTQSPTYYRYNPYYGGYYPYYRNYYPYNRVYYQPYYRGYYPYSTSYSFSYYNDSRRDSHHRSGDYRSHRGHYDDSRHHERSSHR